MRRDLGLRRAGAYIRLRLVLRLSATRGVLRGARHAARTRGRGAAYRVATREPPDNERERKRAWIRQ